ncbi:hypothetical protein V8D89_015509 [Ganoderma adspersum]
MAQAARRAVLVLPLFVTLILAPSCGVYLSMRHRTSRRIAGLRKQVLPVNACFLLNRGTPWPVSGRMLTRLNVTYLPPLAHCYCMRNLRRPSNTGQRTRRPSRTTEVNLSRHCQTGGYEAYRPQVGDPSWRTLHTQTHSAL